MSSTVTAPDGHTETQRRSHNASQPPPTYTSQAYRQVMAFWLTIEVVYDEVTAVESWRRSRGESLTEAAVTHGAQDWVWHTPGWGAVLELRFDDEQSRDAFSGLPVVVAALDAVPDPVSGVLVYPGRGGGSGAGIPRRPRPDPSTGTAHAEQAEEQFLELSTIGPATGSAATTRVNSAGDKCALHA